MATTTGVAEHMDIDTLSYIVSLREKPGLHIDYPYGIKVEKSWLFSLPSPVYPGCAIRVFIKYRKNATSEVRLTRKGGIYYCSIMLRNQRFHLSYGDTNKNYIPIDPKTGAELGTFISFGLRLGYMAVDALINQTADHWFKMNINIRQYNWWVMIGSRDNYIVSLHVYDERGIEFPPTALSQQYPIQFPAPVGSYVTVFAVYTGNSGFSVNFLGDGYTIKGPTYNNVPLKKNETFILTVRNSNKGWMLSTSFLGEKETAIIVPHSGEEKFTDVQFSKDCYITRILAVC